MPLTVWKAESTNIPALSGLQRIFLKDLKADTSLVNKFLKLTLNTDWGVKWVGTAPRRKVVLQESDTEGNEKINVYLVGHYAKDFDAASIGDTIIVANVSVQKSATFNRDGIHACQLVLITQNRPDVWIIPKKVNDPSSSTQNQALSAAISAKLGTTAPDCPQATLAVAPVATPTPAASTAAPVGAQAPAVASSTTAASNIFKDLYSYRYTPLKEVKETRSVDVYGVVKFFKPPYKTSGPDYCMVITIFDPSCEPELCGLKCLIFNPDIQSMPKVLELGDIVRFHRLKVVTYSSELQGQKGPGFSCLVFDGDPDSPVEARSTTANYTITENDKEKVKELRNWAKSGDKLMTRIRLSLSRINPGDYFDLVCQVVAKSYVSRESCVYLKVWDGTKCKLPVQKPSVYQSQTPQVQAEIEKVGNLAVDVCVYGKHISYAQSVQPGNFVRFYNLYVDNSTLVNNGSKILVVLQDGTSFGRGMVVLDQSENIVRSLMRQMESPEEDADEEDGDQPDAAISAPPDQRDREVTDQVSSLNQLFPDVDDDPSVVTLSKVKVGQYFDLTCQVIKVVEMPENSCVCINVWDGTKMNLPHRAIDYTDRNVSMIPSLMNKAGPLAVDVCLYDNHMQIGNKIKPGNFVKVKNLHAPRFPPASMRAPQPARNSTPMVELALHRGTSFGKGVDILQPDAACVQPLKRRLDIISGRRTGGSPSTKDAPANQQSSSNDSNAGVVTSSTTNSLLTSGQDQFNSSDENNSRNSPKIAGGRHSQAKSTGQSRQQRNKENGQEEDEPSELRCMQQFASFTMESQRIKFVPIREAKEISLPNRFRVRAKVISYLPKEVKDFVHLYCPACNHRCGLSFLEQQTPGSPDRSQHKGGESPQRNGGESPIVPTSSVLRRSPRLQTLRRIRERRGRDTGARRKVLQSTTQTGVQSPEGPKTARNLQIDVRYQEADSSQESNHSSDLKRKSPGDTPERPALTMKLRSSKESSPKRLRTDEGLSNSQSSNEYWTASQGSSPASSPTWHQRLEKLEVKKKHGTLTVNNLSATDILNLCKKGVKLSKPPEVCLKYIPLSSAKQGVQFLCPSCCPNRESGPKVLMNYEFLFRLTLADKTDSLEVLVQGENATKFFAGIEPDNLYKDEVKKESLTRAMKALCPTGGSGINPTTDTSENPQLECCIKGVTIVRNGGVHKVYQLVNTQLANEIIES
ncbi:Protection of telomeres protein 1 [Holothuria leucospilota]|uniref:Protection of telomeres protein 1 n=1 Tax=Holothuria leucospilota TaxID=206669 RepID=A0A9Q1HAL1_HOLLE|nr:Protection of telomeres protein 1 [Holothuria leucospilota]